ncbi:MAG TPA: methyltransferase domain-containing protein [Chthoniobacterales bacterium]|nr:methyltransferase domain-containing protein [Chthoniobacterales bacterium]
MEDAEYCCPRCKGTLTSATDAYTCTACKAHYPIIVGIPDFRVFPDPYIDIVEDRRKAQRIFERAAAADFSTVVEYYWSITPDTPPEMARRFTAQAIAAVERGRHLLDSHSVVKAKLQQPDARVLDLGTRTGGVLMAAAERGQKPIGIDIAFRWLIIARKRLEEAGLPAHLVCCCAEFLPFRESAFDVVLAENVLEHTAQQQQLIEEAHRVLKPGGVFFATTWNRLALAPEPHVRLWGVGWLPLGLAKRYVKLRKGVSYDHVRLLSVFQLARMVRRTPFRRCAILLPTFSAAELANVSSAQRLAVGFYHRIKDWSLFRQLLRIFGPVLHLVCVREL